MYREIAKEQTVQKTETSRNRPIELCPHERIIGPVDVVVGCYSALLTDTTTHTQNINSQTHPLKY